MKNEIGEKHQKHNDTSDLYWGKKKRKRHSIQHMNVIQHKKKNLNQHAHMTHQVNHFKFFKLEHVKSINAWVLSHIVSTWLGCSHGQFGL